MKRWLILAGLSAVLSSVGPLRAADDPVHKEARQLAYAGVNAFQAGDFGVASQKLEKAFAMLPVPSVGLYSARALVKLGKWLDAERRYRAVTQLAISSGEYAVQEKARKDAAAELEELRPKIPRLKIDVEGAEASAVAITVDGVAAEGAVGSEQAVDPGKHHIEGSTPSGQAEVDCELHEGEHAVAVLHFTAPPPAMPAPTNQAKQVQPEPPPPAARDHTPLTKTLGFVGVGVGGAALAFSGISALIASGKKPDGCSEGVCAGSVDAYQGWRTVSTVSFWAGAALGATGVVLLITAPRAQSERSVSLSVSPFGASLYGRY